jgi:hypothetical protein
MPHQYSVLIAPCYVYECQLNQLKLEAKLAESTATNNFIDFDYLNKMLPSFSDTLGSSDYSVSFDLTQTSHCPYQVDLTEKTTSTNLIDMAIRLALADIDKHSFPCIITHVNSIRDFYVQKIDKSNEQLLADLQELIQSKCANQELKQLDSLELNQLCVAFYPEDGQFYRAKIIDTNSGE